MQDNITPPYPTPSHSSPNLIHHHTDIKLTGNSARTQTTAKPIAQNITKPSSEPSAASAPAAAVGTVAGDVVVPTVAGVVVVVLALAVTVVLKGTVVGITEVVNVGP